MSRRRVRRTLPHHRHAPSNAGHVNVTPLIDVVMVLIIFYLVVGQMVLDRRGSIELPPSASGEKEDPRAEPIAIIVGRDGSVTIDGLDLSADDIGLGITAIRAKDDRTRAIQIRGERGTTYGTVRAVLGEIRDAGITRVQLAASEAGGLLSGTAPTESADGGSP